MRVGITVFPQWPACFLFHLWQLSGEGGGLSKHSVLGDKTSWLQLDLLYGVAPSRLSHLGL